MLNTTFKTKICVGLGKRTIPYLKEREAFKQRPRSMHARVVVDQTVHTTAKINKVKDLALNF